MIHTAEFNGKVLPIRQFPYELPNGAWIDMTMIVCVRKEEEAQFESVILDGINGKQYVFWYGHSKDDLEWEYRKALSLTGLNHKFIQYGEEL